METKLGKTGMLFLVGVIVAVAAPSVWAEDLKPQTTCPIMGGKINKDVFVDAAGYRFYACCPGCLAKIEADPATALATLKERGETAELHLAVCPKCGEIRGAADCCKAGAAKCPKCGMNKGSIGCCKDLKLAADQEVGICPKCGEAKGSANCCKAGVAKCPKCGLNKGSTGCCKDLKPAADQEVVICPKCGEVKGSATCCKSAAEKCPKCGLVKGSPGCCKIDSFIR